MIVNIALLFITILYFYFILSVAKRLEKHHVGEWEILGCPSLLNTSPINSLKLFAYIFVGNYRKKDDKVLWVRVWLSRACFLAILSMLIYFAVSERL